METRMAVEAGEAAVDSQAAVVWKENQVDAEAEAAVALLRKTTEAVEMVEMLVHLETLVLLVFV